MESGHTPHDLLGGLNAVERKHAPGLLFTAGNIALLRRSPRVSIIGSRTASVAGLRAAHIASIGIASRGGVVVSGLARGVDTAAHLAAIEAGGTTVAVIGTPLSCVYPPENAHLQAQLMRDYLVVSQFATGHPVSRQNFVLRNRTMALISHATIIIEAGEKSGTAHQGWEAIRLGRLLLLPRALIEAGFNWPREMCTYGAMSYGDLDDLGAILDEHLPASVEEPSELPF